MPSSLCILPWMSLEATPTGNFRPCCLAEDLIVDEEGNPYDIAKGGTLKEAFGSGYMQNLRQQFTNGEKPSTCKKCWALESSGGESKRLISNKKFGTNTDQKKLSFLDLKLGNICNLKCRICGTWSSSKWAQEEIALGNDDAKRVLKLGAWPRKENKLWSEVVDMLVDVKYFEFTGGEPFLIQEHFDLLSKSVELGHAKKQSIHYNTNGTTFPQKAVDDIWPHFDVVEIAFSIDDVGERFEYQRHGAKWDQVAENIKKFNNLKATHSNIKTQICCTINIQNIYNLDTVADWIRTQDFDYVFYNYLHESKEWNVQYLPTSIKNKIQQKLVKYNNDTFHKQQLHGAINFMMDKNLDNAEMRQMRNQKIQGSDKFRNESFADTFPELKELLWQK